MLGLLVGWSSPASAHCKPQSGGPHAEPDHFGCGGPPPPPSAEIIYTVAVVNPVDLITGVPTGAVAAFEFGPVAAALDTDTSLFLVGSGDLEFDRPGDYDNCLMNPPDIGIQEACEAWDAVFDQCTRPFDDSVPTIDSFDVSFGNVGVWESGDRTVGINGILLPTADDPVVQVWVHLIGPDPEETGVVYDFVPRDGDGELTTGTTRIPMVRVWFGGRTVKGVTPKTGCHPKGNGIPDTVDIEAGGEGTLVITAKAVED